MKEKNKRNTGHLYTHVYCVYLYIVAVPVLLRCAFRNRLSRTSTIRIFMILIHLYNSFHSTYIDWSIKVKFIIMHELNQLNTSKVTLLPVSLALPRLCPRCIKKTAIPFW